MKSTSIRRAMVPGLAVLALAMSACGAGNESAANDGGTLNGGGATSQAKAEGVWRAAYQEANDGVTVNYEEVGSGTGVTNFTSEAYDFAGSDSYLTDDEGALTAATERCNGEAAIEVPAYISPIAVAFNVEDIDALNLSAETIADIFTGAITSWDDEAIAADNPDVELPALDISVIHRSDDSGTTKNFTDYLSKAGNGAWTASPDGVWPVELTEGQGLEGTSGVVGGITDTNGAIGYADHSATSGLGVASIQVGEEWVAPSAEGAAKVLAISPRVEGRASVDLATDIDRTTTESGAYPLLLTSYLIACQHYDDAATADLVKGFLSYVLSAEGQQAAADETGSAPLDSKVLGEAAAIVDAISAG